MRSKVYRENVGIWLQRCQVSSRSMFDHRMRISDLDVGEQLRHGCEFKEPSTDIKGVMREEHAGNTSSGNPQPHDASPVLDSRGRVRQAVEDLRCYQGGPESVAG